MTDYIFHNFRFSFVFLFVFCFSNNYSQTIFITDSTSQINLGNHASVFLTIEDSILPFNLKNSEWKKVENGLNFGVVDNILWAKFDFNNPHDHSLIFTLYSPYHHIRSIKYYQKINDSIKFLSHLGTTQPYSEKEIQTPGYGIRIDFPPGGSSVYMRLKHQFIPLRANSFLVNEKTLNSVISETNSLFSNWEIILAMTVFFTLIMFFFTKLKVFLYYGILNFGVLLFVGTDIGLYFLFFNQNTDLTLIDINQIGNSLVMIIFPFFLNEITPIKDLNPTLWKIILTTILVTPILLLSDIFFSARGTLFFYCAIWFVMINCVFVFLSLLYLLFLAIIKKRKNAKSLFVLYLFYILSVFYEILLPNMGINRDSIYSYDLLLKSSIVEIILFLVLIAKEMNSIFKERNNLLVEQKNLQQEMLKAVVTIQEQERNTLGRELHDMIGANMSVVKQNIDKSNTGLVKIMDDTIDSVRFLSHGLMTPKVEGDQFMDEIIDLCLLSSNDSFKANFYFHEWRPLKKEENSTHLYRIIQELLQNTLKHSGATEAYIQILRKENKVTLLFEDNGKGFNTEKEKKKGKGLLGIEHRTEILKGNIRYDSSNKGTYVELNFEG
ncbi:MAG: sensor histidine kinase [Flavobacteriales bacterium]